MDKLAKNSESNFLRVPTLAINRIDSEHLAVRFEQIGDRNRFRLILQRFRADFLLAVCQELEGQPWWVIAISQLYELEEFGKRNGIRLRFVENGSGQPAFNKEL
jgi:hypothetical protein